MKKILIYSVLFLFLSYPAITRASDVYTINLSYNSQTKVLSFDKLASKNVAHDTSKDISIVEFEKNKGVGTYVLKLYRDSDSEIFSYEFNPQAGSFSVDIPYFSLATSLKVFQKSSGKELLSADLSSYSTCNANGVCEFEKGENGQNCIGDCGNIKNTYSPETQNLLKQNNGILKDPQTGQVLLKDKSFAGNSSSTPSQNSNSASSVSVPSNQQNTPANTAAAAVGFGPILTIVFVVVVIIFIGFFVYRKFFRR